MENPELEKIAADEAAKEDMSTCKHKKPLGKCTICEAITETAKLVEKEETRSPDKPPKYDPDRPASRVTTYKDGKIVEEKYLTKDDKDEESLRVEEERGEELTPPSTKESEMPSREGIERTIQDLRSKHEKATDATEKSRIVSEISRLRGQLERMSKEDERDLAV